MKWLILLDIVSLCAQYIHFHIAVECKPDVHTVHHMLAVVYLPTLRKCLARAILWQYHGHKCHL